MRRTLRLPVGARAARQPHGARSAGARRRRRRLRHGRASELGRLVRRLRRAAGSSARCRSRCPPSCLRASSRQSSSSPSRRSSSEPSPTASRTPCAFRSGTSRLADLDDGPLPDAVSPAWKAPTSGGSTGRPKLIVSGDPSLIDDEAPSALGFERDGCLVMPGPLYHNGPAVWSCQSLLIGSHVRTAPALRRGAHPRRHRGAPRRRRLPRADDDEADLRLPDDVRARYDLSSLRVVWHLAEPCPRG